MHLKYLIIAALAGSATVAALAIPKDQPVHDVRLMSRDVDISNTILQARDSLAPPVGILTSETLLIRL
jgi:hypothetical protein